MLELFSAKKPVEKRPNIWEMRQFWKSAIMQRLQPLQNGHFGSKIKIEKKYAENDSLIMLELFCAKNAWEKNKYSRNNTILKIGHHAKAIALAK